MFSTKSGKTSCHFPQQWLGTLRSSCVVKPRRAWCAPIAMATSGRPWGCAWMRRIRDRKTCDLENQIGFSMFWTWQMAVFLGNGCIKTYTAVINMWVQWMGDGMVPWMLGCTVPQRHDTTGTEVQDHRFASKSQGRRGFSRAICLPSLTDAHQP